MKSEQKRKTLSAMLAVLLSLALVGQTFLPAFAEEETPETTATETATEATEAPTEEATEAPTEEATEAPTEEATEAPTEEETEAPAEESTEAPTEEATEAPTEEETEAPAEDATEAPTEEATEAPTEAPTVSVTAWAWDDEEGNLDYDETTGYVLTLTGITSDEPVMFSDVVSLLPASVTAEATLALTWSCGSFPADGAASGDYIFTASLPNGYALAAEAPALEVTVRLYGTDQTSEAEDSSTAVTLDETNFPDANFRSYLESNFADYITTADDGTKTIAATNIAEMDCSGKSISDLTGIEYFTNLTYLNCSRNQLTDLNVDSNTALVSLYCSGNQFTSVMVTSLPVLTTLDVSNNALLIILFCWNNSLTTLDVSGCTTLTTLDCGDSFSGGNQLTTLDVSSNTALESLYCVSNQLTSLDVSNNAALTELDCSGNQLISLDVSNNTGLSTLLCKDNKLTELSLGANTVMSELYCTDNKLTSLDVSNNTGLRILYCNDNKLTELSLGANTVMSELYCGNNQLTVLDISKNTAIKYLECYSNQLTALDISNNTALTGLYCCNNSGLTVTYGDTEPNSLVVEHIDSDSNGLCDYCSYVMDEDIIGVTLDETNFPDENFRSYLESNFADYITTADDGTETIYPASITKISCSSKNISDLTGIGYFTSLTDLYCPYNALTGLDVSDCITLTELNCGYNALTTLDVSDCITLTELNCEYNTLTTLDVSNNTALTTLSCLGNQLTSLDVSKNNALNWLMCCSNQLTTLDVSSNTMLKTLDCSGNNLTSLNVSSNTVLENLTCNDNQLTSLDVSSNTMLKTLDCSGNNLTSLNVSNNTALKTLDCSDNKLTALDVSNNTALTSLSCCYNSGLTVTYGDTNPSSRDHKDSDGDGLCNQCGYAMDGKTAKIAGYDLSLSGNIGVNFYMELSDEAAADTSAQMIFTLPNGDTSEITIADATTDSTKVSGKTYYVFPCEVAAKEITGSITAQITFSDGTQSTAYTYSVRQYAEYLLSHQEVEAYAAAADLVKAMLNYGAYAQQNFGFNTDDLANEDYEISVDSVTSDTVASYQRTKSGTSESVKFSGADLVLLSETTLRLYFTVTDGASATYTLDGAEVTATKSGSEYYVAIPNIASSALGTNHTVVATGSDGQTVTVSYSPMSYAYAAMTSTDSDISGDTALQNTVKALYQYYQAAVSYSG